MKYALYNKRNSRFLAAFNSQNGVTTASFGAETHQSREALLFDTFDEALTLFERRCRWVGFQDEDYVQRYGGTVPNTTLFTPGEWTIVAMVEEKPAPPPPLRSLRIEDLRQ